MDTWLQMSVKMKDLSLHIIDIVQNSNPGIRMVFRFKGAMKEYVWDSIQIRIELDGIPLSEKEVMT